MVIQEVLLMATSYTLTTLLAPESGLNAMPAFCLMETPRESASPTVAGLEDCPPAKVRDTVQLVIFVGLIFVVWGAQMISWVYIFVMYLL